MIESRYASSSGSSFSSAIFKPSFGRCILINAVVKFAIGSRSTASNAGRIHGSNRRSTCRRKVNVSLSQFKNAEPVSARGCGRLAFELETDIGSGLMRREPLPLTSFQWAIF